MLASARLSLGLTLSRLRFMRMKEAGQQFTAVITRARRALILLPQEMNDPTPVQMFLRQFSSRFKIRKLVVVTNSQRLASFPIGSFNFVAYSDGDISKLYLPKGALRRKLDGSFFDIAVDLNKTLFLPAAFLCKYSRAPIRIGFTKPHGDRFYNFQFTLSADAKPGGEYDRLFKCLDMF